MMGVSSSGVERYLLVQVGSSSATWPSPPGDPWLCGPTSRSGCLVGSKRLDFGATGCRWPPLSVGGPTVRDQAVTKRRSQLSMCRSSVARTSWTR